MNLQTFNAWDAQDTSQRRVLAGLGTRSTLVLGGNLVGKSTLARILAVCAAVGTRHPLVRGLLDRHGIDSIPGIGEGPGDVILGAVTHDSSLAFHREQVAELLEPFGVTWWNRTGRNEAAVWVDVPGAQVEGYIRFSSGENGAHPFKGARAFVIFDEVPPYLAWAEATIANTCVMLGTPLGGEDLLYERAQVNTHQHRTHWLNSCDNPHVDGERLTAVLMGSMSEEEVLLRTTGRRVEHA